MVSAVFPFMKDEPTVHQVKTSAELLQIIVDALQGQYKKLPAFLPDDKGQRELAVGSERVRQVIAAREGQKYVMNLLAHQPPITGNLEDNLEVNRKVVEERMKEEEKK